MFDFAYEMTFGGKGEHRSHRSGGDKVRTPGEIFADTFQGKIAECAACNYFYKYDKSVEPDFFVEKLKKWDSVDLTVCGKEIAVKSTKSYGNLLLLETKDWDMEGNYIPNLNSNNFRYDLFVMIRIKPSCEDLMKKHNLLYSYSVDYEFLKNIIYSESWEYDCPGFISNEELKYIINNEYIIEKGSKLNNTIMDAENYYVQSGDFHNINAIDEKLKSDK